MKADSSWTSVEVYAGAGPECDRLGNTAWGRFEGTADRLRFFMDSGSMNDGPRRTVAVAKWLEEAHVRADTLFMASRPDVPGGAVRVYVRRAER